MLTDLISSTVGRWIINRLLDSIWSNGAFLGRFRSFRDRNTVFKLPSKLLTDDDLCAMYAREDQVIISAPTQTISFPASWLSHGSSEISFNFQNTKIELDPRVQSRTKNLLEHLQKRSAKEKHLHDGRPFCLLDFYETTKGCHAEVARCSYFDSMRTHFGLDVKGQEGTLREFLSRENQKLPPIGSGQLTDHIGIVACIETSDGKLVFQERSKKVSIRPLSLTASIAGTLEEDDISEYTENKDFIQALRKGLIREGIEELGVDISSNGTPIKFLGGIREYFRGGFPDFYFYAKITQTSEDILESWSFAKGRDEALGFRFLDFDSTSLSNPNRDSEVNFDKRFLRLYDDIDNKGNITALLSAALAFDLIKREYRSA